MHRIIISLLLAGLSATAQTFSGGVAPHGSDEAGPGEAPVNRKAR
jgi:hypothetical protein